MKGSGVPWHRDPRARAIVFQITFVILLIWFFYGVATNTVENMKQRGIIVGLGFMTDVAPFNVGFSPFWDYQLGKSKYWEVMVVGIQNTILVSFLAIISSTILGFFIGIMRLSPNWLISRLSSLYVEVFRNIPLPLWIFFWYIAVFLPVLPAPRNSAVFAETIYLNREGIYLPKVIFGGGMETVLFAMLVVLSMVAIIAFWRYAKRRQDETGKTLPVVTSSAVAFIAAPVVSYWLVTLTVGQPLSLDYPQLGRFNLNGGLRLSLSFFVMWFVLTAYTAAYIGENVRGGIRGVVHGQTEAAYSLGIRRLPALQLIVIPQAMRIIIPPTISQYLNLTKNSSLGVIVAYEDIVSLFAGITLNQTGQALPIITITIFIYVTLTLTTSAILNLYNKRVQIVQR